MNKLEILDFFYKLQHTFNNLMFVYCYQPWWTNSSLHFLIILIFFNFIHKNILITPNLFIFFSPHLIQFNTNFNKHHHFSKINTHKNNIILLLVFSLYKTNFLHTSEALLSSPRLWVAFDGKVSIENELLRATTISLVTYRTIKIRLIAAPHLNPYDKNYDILY